MRLPTPGFIYYGLYARFHHDKRPLVFILYSDMTYTHALNLHYFPRADYDRLVKLFVKIKDDEKVNKLFKRDKRAFYHNWLKRHFHDVIDNCYRTYHTGLAMFVPTTALALTGIGLYAMNTYQDKMPRNKKYNQLRKAARKDPEMISLMKEYNIFRTQSATMQMIRSTRKSWKK